jgi:general secretion pathway protein C
MRNMPWFSGYHGGQGVGVGRQRLILVVELVLLAAVAVQGARLVWALVTPVGPVGYAPIPGIAAVASALSPDPFFGATQENGGAAVTSLPLKLFGVRVDEAVGRGSAIIATPDGVQSSFGVGEAILPGVVLKAVARDNVVIARNGADERLFLDQSVPGDQPKAAR